MALKSQHNSEKSLASEAGDGNRLPNNVRNKGNGDLMAADLRHLKKVGQTWHYFRRVPRRFQHIDSRTFVERSLYTGNLDMARPPERISRQPSAPFLGKRSDGAG